MNIKHLKPLPEDQETTVEQMYQHHPNRRYRQRAHMILLSAQGYSYKEIAGIVRVTPRAVSKYVKRYRKHGFLGLYDAPIPGRPPKITREIQEHMDKYLEKSPREYGYNMSTWTTPLMQYHLLVSFGIAVCVETVRLWFRRLGYRLILPRHQLLFIRSNRAMPGTYGDKTQSADDLPYSCQGEMLMKNLMNMMQE